jgi:hypothetical protein
MSKARAAGKKWYFTGRPCRHLHVTLRQTANRTCGACLRRSDGQPKQPAYLPELLSSWIDPKSNDPRRVENALRIIMKRVQRWQQYGRAAETSRAMGLRRGQSEYVKVPDDFYSADGVALTARGYIVGPWHAPAGSE